MHPYISAGRTQDVGGRVGEAHCECRVYLRNPRLAVLYNIYDMLAAEACKLIAGASV